VKDVGSATRARPQSFAVTGVLEHLSEPDPGGTSDAFQAVAEPKLSIRLKQRRQKDRTHTMAEGDGFSALVDVLRLATTMALRCHGPERTAQVDPSSSDAPASKGLPEAKPKIRRRPHTPAVVRAIRTNVIPREEWEEIISTIETIAQGSDSQRKLGPEAENGGESGDRNPKR
jgi:hypothetical protein